jgi:MFS family permease
MAATYLAGRISDKTGRRRMVISGWTVYAAVYFAFGLFGGLVPLIIIFLCYGLYFGLCEPCEKAWVADLVPEHVRGSAFGYYHACIGIGALPASLVFGFIWKAFGPGAAFFFGAGLALAASFLLRLVKSGGRCSEGFPKS